ncbi:ethanolamine permease [Chitinophaga sancti]|uniref:Ethanolamine permease n=1 Tax=Chitinophaga sancti TaxID=1004 RepID=A0A1K1M3S3_9BACT|nr:ethanolamine permease [Chitinophaga sancti]WQD64658.1 ethanolamine permease [Chitinophaga sancti]WQG89720.1 ethanolamine permease [Chitinophaga sancti]SFW17737.1 ethanolamine permease [Chitinophaga sancti]
MSSSQSLKKVIRPIHLWAIGVGLVISGEYFGWNYGWGVAGTMGFLITTLVITLLYITFIFSFTELTTSIPQAGGPFTYTHRAMGPVGGLIAGYATAVEFLLATPAIALALGNYLHFLHPALPVLGSGLAFYIILTVVNLLGIKESALFSLIITLLAVVELLIYLGIVGPSFKTANFLHDAMPFGWSGVFNALPFAIWLYVCIEGIAMVAEEVKDPHRNIPKGYISAILTLMLLALAVMVFTGGITDWKSLSAIDYPLPEAIGVVLGKQNGITKLFAGIGLFGLIASFNGIIISYSRQLFALGRAGYLPGIMSTLSPRRRVPVAALITGGLLGVIALYMGKTDQLVILSVMGAIVMYILSMVSLFILRVKDPALERPYKAPLYPWFPGIALFLSIVSLFAIIYTYPMLSLIFFGGLAVALVIFIGMGRHKHQAVINLLSEI